MKSNDIKLALENQISIGWKAISWHDFVILLNEISKLESNSI